MAVLRLSSAVILAFSLMSPLVLAIPAPRAIKARDYVTEVVTETVWTTVTVTTTVYVDELPSTSVSATTTAEAVPTPVAEPKHVAPQGPVPEEASSEPASLEPTSSEAKPAGPSPEAAEHEESPEPPAPEYTPPVISSLPTVPDNTPSATAPAPAPEATSSPNTPVIEAVQSSGGSESADCQGPSSSCKGKITHWDGGLSACGTVVDTNAEYAFALPFELMGSRSNDNPYCGKSITIRNPTTGKTVVGTVQDKCMGCYDRHIDCTNAVFNDVTEGKGDGVEYDYEWYFN